METSPWSGGRGGEGTAIGEGWFSIREPSLTCCSTAPAPSLHQVSPLGSPTTKGFPPHQPRYMMTVRTVCPTITLITSQPLEPGVIFHQSIYPRAWHMVDYSLERGPTVAPDSLYIIENLWGKVCSGAAPCLAVLWADCKGRWAAKAPGKMPAVH